MRTFSTSLIPGLLVLGLSAHTAGAQTSQRAVSGTGSAKSQVAGSSQAPAAKIKFRPYEMTDPQLGMPANRIAIPADWKANSLLVWNINAYYMPVFGQIRGFGDYGFPESHAASWRELGGHILPGDVLVGRSDA